MAVLGISCEGGGGQQVPAPSAITETGTAATGAIDIASLTNRDDVISSDNAVKFKQQKEDIFAQLLADRTPLVVNTDVIVRKVTPQLQEHDPTKTIALLFESPFRSPFLDASFGVEAIFEDPITPGAGIRLSTIGSYHQNHYFQEADGSFSFRGSNGCVAGLCARLFATSVPATHPTQAVRVDFSIDCVERGFDRFRGLLFHMIDEKERISGAHFFPLFSVSPPPCP
ncbi:MAG: hypothetical protein AAB309_06700 [Deltaproteobacteria bacterium]